jgi:hypothetical protein
MQLTTLLATLALTLPSILADPIVAPLPAGLTPAKQFRRSPSLNSNGALLPRLDVDPDSVCGSNYEECPTKGWCCSAGTPCAGDISGIPVCKDPSFTLGPLKGTAVATPFKNLEGVLSSLGGMISSLANGDVPGGVYTAVMTTAPTSGDATNTAAAAGSSNTEGAAVAVKPVGFGGAVVGTVAVWGAAVMGGMGWMLMN